MSYTSSKRKVTLRKTNFGQYFRLTDSDTAPVWVRGEFVKSEGKYSCSELDDNNNEELMKPTQKVVVGFTL